MAKNELKIRSSAAEFLIFEQQSHANGIEVIYQDGTLWMSQRMMGLLFDVESNTITYHLGEIYKSGELEQISTTRKIRVVQQEGSRNVNREIDHYNLDAIISVGYRVNSIKATQFRRWATQVLSQYTQKGYVIDRKRMEKYLLSDDRDILADAGKISMEIAKDHAESEYEKYRVIQDQLYESDFDKLVMDAKK